MAALTSSSAADLPRKVRVVAKIRRFGDEEAEIQGGIPLVSVNKPAGEASDSVTVTFGEQPSGHKDSYEVDYGYEKDEDNGSIFSREVKPLVSEVFKGSSATVVAYGARNTGKTSIIQGSFEKPGLAALAMNEILSAAEENQNSVTVSLYEVYHDRVCDLLDTKQQPVFVLEDKRGKVLLKGLSKVPVRTLTEFQKLYVGFSPIEPLKKTSEPAPRGHRGLIVQVSSSDDNLRHGTMNFVDLAGYEGIRRKTVDGSNSVEQRRINTSVYAFLNVIHSLVVNESHVPFRESKLARILQGSLGGSSKVLMIACLNPTFCQDSIYMMSLASRSCQHLNKAGSKSAKKIQSSVRSKMIQSNNSEAQNKAGSVPATKHLPSLRRKPLSEKKVNGTVGPSGAKGRELFGKKTDTTQSNKVESRLVDNVPAIEQSSPSNEVLDSSRSCQHPSNVGLKSTKKGQISVRSKMIPPNKSQVPNKIGSATAKKHLSSQRRKPLSGKKAYGIAGPSGAKGGELFGEKIESSTPSNKVESYVVDSVPAVEQSSPSSKVESFLVDNAPVVEQLTPSNKENVLSDDPKHDEQTGIIEMDVHQPGVDVDTNVNLVTVEQGENETENSPPISARLRELSNNLKALCSETPRLLNTVYKNDASTLPLEPRTPLVNNNSSFNALNSPWNTLVHRSAGIKSSVVHEYLKFMNTADKDELKKLRGIGEKRATWILELRDESPEPFKSVEDLKNIGISGKMVNEMMKLDTEGGLFS